MLQRPVSRRLNSHSQVHLEPDAVGLVLSNSHLDSRHTRLPLLLVVRSVRSTFLRTAVEHDVHLLIDYLHFHVPAATFVVRVGHGCLLTSHLCWDASVHLDL